MMYVCDQCGDTGDVAGARADLLQRGKLHCAACGAFVRPAELGEEFISALKRIASILGLATTPADLSTDVPNAVDQVTAERDALLAERDRLRAVVVHRLCWGPGMGLFDFCKGCPEKRGSCCGLTCNEVTQ